MTTLDDLLTRPSPALPPAPWADLERIDDTVRRVATKLQEAPWLLSKLLPSLTVLARDRSARWGAWAQQAEHHAPADLRAWLEPPQPLPHPAPCAPSPTTPAAELAPPPAPPTPVAPVAESPTPVEPVAAHPASVAPAAEPSVALAAEPRVASVVGSPPPVALAAEPPPPVEFSAPITSPAALVTPEARALVTPETLKTFALDFGRRRHTSSLVHERDPMLCRRENLVREILERLGELPSRIERLQASLWRDRAEALTAPDWLQRWTELDRALQVDLLTLMVALGRAAQEASMGKEEPRKMFHRLSAYSREQQPGFTHGMARNHQPRHGGWLTDARKAQDALRAWLGERPTSSVLKSASMPPLAKTQAESRPEKPAARKTPMRLETPTQPETSLSLEDSLPGEPALPVEEEGPSSLVEEDWAWWPEVRDKRAILVGGSPKEPCRRRLLEAFHFAALDWVDGDVRRISSVTERIAHGGLDLVLIVRDFIGHKISKKVVFSCKNHRVPFVFVERGHGVLAVRRSIERYLRNATSLSA